MKNIFDSTYKQKFIEAVKEKIRTADGWVNRHRAITLIFTAIVILLVISFFAPSQNIDTDSNQNASIAPVVSEQDKQNLADSFCKNRSGKYVGHVNLEDFSTMIESGKETTLHSTRQDPTAASCRKVAEECLAMWPETECQNIAERKIWIGMNVNQLYLSWGIPRDKNNTVTRWGISTQWIYGDSYVYLEGKSDNDLKVTSWQD